MQMPNHYGGNENSENECKNLCTENLECLGYNYGPDGSIQCLLWVAEGTVFTAGTPEGYYHITNEGDGTMITAAYREDSFYDDTQCMKKIDTSTSNYICIVFSLTLAFEV